MKQERTKEEGLRRGDVIEIIHRGRTYRWLIKKIMTDSQGNVIGHLGFRLNKITGEIISRRKYGEVFADDLRVLPPLQLYIWQKLTNRENQNNKGRTKKERR